MNNRFLLALKNKPFLFLWLAEIASQLAMNMMNFLLLLVAYTLTNSNTAVSGIVLSFTVPAIVFGILAGIYVDRWNKKSVLFMTNFLRAVLAVILGLLHTNLIVLYFITFIIAIITQFFIPAETPMIPLLVKKQELLSANALFGFAVYGSIMLAYALSGPLLLLTGSKNALFILAGVFSLACLFVTLIRVPVPEKLPGQFEKVDHSSIFQEVKQTIFFLLKMKRLSHAFSLLVLSQTLIFIIAVIGPGYAKHILGISIAEFPLFFVTPAVLGMGLGTYLLTNFFHNKRKESTATAGLFLTSIALFLLPYGSKVTSREFVRDINIYLPHFLKINNLHIMVVLAFVMGIANALVFVPSNTIVQEETSDEVRGKVYGALNTVVSLVSLVPVILVGSLADIFGVAVVLTVLAIGVVLIGVGRLFL